MIVINCNAWQCIVSWFFLLRDAMHETLKPFYKSQVAVPSYVCLVIFSKKTFLHSTFGVLRSRKLICIRRTPYGNRAQEPNGSVRKTSGMKELFVRMILVKQWYREVKPTDLKEGDKIHLVNFHSCSMFIHIKSFLNVEWKDMENSLLNYLPFSLWMGMRFNRWLFRLHLKVRSQSEVIILSVDVLNKVS